jgi:hypothetical protein
MTRVRPQLVAQLPNKILSSNPSTEKALKSYAAARKETPHRNLHLGFTKAVFVTTEWKPPKCPPDA